MTASSFFILQDIPKISTENLDLCPPASPLNMKTIQRLQESKKPFISPPGKGGGGVNQSVASVTPGGEVLGSIPAVAASSLLVGSVLVLCDRLR